jgi:hypothetical protein
VAVGVVLGRQHQLGTPEAEHLAALDGLALQHEELELVAFYRGRHPQGDSGVAAGGLDDGHPGPQLTPLLGLLDHKARNAVFERARGVA